jgi:proline iminopeptidase
VAAAKQSAYALSEFEGSIGSLEGSYEPTDFKSFDPSGIQIEIHYTSQLCFMPDRYIFDHAHELTMPIHLVQGRFDAVCPPITAYELDKLLPNSTLQFTISGHSGSDSGNLAVMQSLIAQFP